ncbi:MAG: hypothetical protein GYB31_21050 [Bacteroidetes bacterium]|nr:hypothetical protein [Bacteroidota bacterium]
MRQLSIALFSLVFLCLSAKATLAQDSDKLDITYEEIQKQCEDKPLNERIRVVVTKFNVTTGYRSYELGDNMATMLTNALQGVNCYRVLESWSNQEDFMQELDVNEEYMDPNTVNEKGKLQGAQLVVTGEVTEFSIQTKSVGVLGVRTNKEIVKLGFVLKLINPVTRDILYSESINVEGKAHGSGSLGLSIPRFGRINLAGASNDNPAVANALEQGVIVATEKMTRIKDQLELPEAPDPNSTLTTIQISNADYMAVRNLETVVQSAAGVSSVEKTFENNTGTLRVRHTGATEELLDKIYGSIQTGYEITEVSNGTIGLKKQ